MQFGEPIVDDGNIPLWLKLVITGFVPGISVTIGWMLVSERAALFGLSAKLVLIALVLFLALSLCLAVCFWYFPQSQFSQLAYLVLRASRDLFSVLALFGMVYLVMMRTVLFSPRGSALYGVLTVLFIAGWRLKPLTRGRVSHLVNSGYLARLKKQLAGGSIPTWTICAVLALLPAMIVCATIYFVLHSSLANYGPYSFWNDEISYWVWLRSFRYVGFHVGYNAPNELLSAFEFSRYGEASPFYLYIYGILARLVAWFPAVPVVINFILLTLSIYLYLYFMKFDIGQVLFSGLAILFTWPVLLYLPLTTHETLNQVIGIISAAVFIRLLREREHVRGGKWGLMLLIIYVATLIRLSWGLLFIPVVFYGLEGNHRKRLTLAVLIGGALYMSVFVLMSYLLPMVNNSIFGTIRGGLINSLLVIPGKIIANLTPMFMIKDLNPNIAVMFQMVIVIGWSLQLVWVMFRSGAKCDLIASDGGLLDLYIVGSLLGAGLIFYLPAAFYRTFAPVMLLVYLLLVHRREYGRLVPLLLVNALMFSSYLTYFKGIGDYRIIEMDYTTPQPWNEETEAAVAKLIVYDPNAKNPWCNTLLIPLDYYDARLMLVPPGIGVSYIFNPDTYQTPIKSRYALLDQVSYEKFGMRSNLEMLESLPVGTLYLNKDVDCR